MLHAFGYCSMIPLMPSIVTKSKSYRSSNFKNVLYSLFFKHLVSETRPPKSSAFEAILNTVLQSYGWEPLFQSTSSECDIREIYSHYLPPKENTRNLN